ncbi:MAG: trypsin-like serine protease [Deltaproteobacteria bacterium]|nr:trypsin-like serine protease [Deltaproteobacteria bacterium]
MKKILMFVLIFSFGCNEPLPHISSQQKTINDGISEPGEPGVVLIYHQMGAMCTGTLVKPDIVITAKHCVRDLDSGWDLPVSGFSIRIGPDMYTVEDYFSVSSIHTYPGTEIEDQDIALMVLQQEIPAEVAEPYEIVYDLHGDFMPQTDETLLTIIGYGESVCGEDGNAGIKLRTEDTFLGYLTSNGDFITQGRGANHGDSGGPVFSPDMKLFGITSRGSGECSGEYAGITIATSIAHHMGIIRDVFESVGYCAPTRETEICDDGIDDNCDGLIDEACLSDGEICEQDWECENGICFEQDGVQKCLKSCNPYEFINSCGSGSYCRITECGKAICAPGDKGDLEFYDKCNQDQQCKSSFCRQAVDGEKRCLYPCEKGKIHCLEQEFCLTVEEGCGGCHPFEVAPNQARSTGEFCSSDSQCETGECLQFNNYGYCTVACSETSSCGEGFHCLEGSCVKGEPGVVGTPCVGDQDCDPSLFCKDFGGVIGRCTRECAASEDCPEAGFLCRDNSDGSYCRGVTGAELGDDCSKIGCKTGFLCKQVVDGESRCVSICHRYMEQCAPNTGCTAFPEDNLNYCVPFDIVSSGGGSSSGCSTNPGSKNKIPGLISFFLLLSVFYLKKRRT